MEGTMPDDKKIIRWGVIIAAVIVVVRIALELAGAPNLVNNVFGIAWLYFIFPVIFALVISARNDASPYKRLLKDILLFAFFTRVMVLITYILAYVFHWKAKRFAYPGGTVGENVSALSGILLIPLRNLLLWMVIAAIVGMIIGSLTLLLKHKSSLQKNG
jgi:hypothetical protein